MVSSHTSFHAGHRCGSKLSHCDRTFTCFPPLTACTTWYNEHRKESSRLEPTCLTQHSACCIFSNRDVSSITEAIKGHGNVSHCCGGHMTYTDQLFKSRFFIPVTGGCGFLVPVVIIVIPRGIIS